MNGRYAPLKALCTEEKGDNAQHNSKACSSLFQVSQFGLLEVNVSKSQNNTAIQQVILYNYCVKAWKVIKIVVIENSAFLTCFPISNPGDKYFSTS